MRWFYGILLGTALSSFSGGDTALSPLPAAASTGNVSRVNGLGLAPQSLARRATEYPCTAIYSFGATRTDGLYPQAGLIALNGTLYGTTYEGGRYGKGTVFAVSPRGAERVLHQFGGPSDGANPQAALIEVGGLLFGTTYDGGTDNRGTVFEIGIDGGEKIIHSFSKSASDGANPQAELLAIDGVLYGTTDAGGAHEAGTVFAVSTAGAERVLYSFGRTHADGANPQAALTNVSGALVGTTYAGGVNGAGTVFALNMSGAEKVLYNFGQTPTDAANPQAGLLDVNGVLYGTTQQGGVNGLGTIFALSRSGVERVEHSFGGASDGQLPAAGLIDISGKLYGTTYQGGARNLGTVFAFRPGGTESVLYSFTGPAGKYPQAGLTAMGASLYGTTFDGGANIYYGAVFALTL